MPDRVSRAPNALLAKDRVRAPVRELKLFKAPNRGGGLRIYGVTSDPQNIVLGPRGPDGEVNSPLEILDSKLTFRPA